MPGERGVSAIFITAALSAVALIAVLGWQIARSVGAQNSHPPIVSSVNGAFFSASSSAPSGATDAVASSTDALSSLGSTVIQQLEGAYAQLLAAGEYSSTTAVQAGRSLAPYISANVQYPAFTSADIKTDSDTSYKRMLQYRSDLQTSLAPLLQNTQPEYEIFAYYVQTKDAGYLTKLEAAAENYRAAASSTATVLVPKDAVGVQVGMLNAMEEFAATLDAMSAHASDPFASAALLENYNQAENDMVSAFNALANYAKSKTP